MLLSPHAAALKFLQKQLQKLRCHIGLYHRRCHQQGDDVHDEQAQQILHQGTHNALFVVPDVVCDLAAEIDAAAEGQDQGRQLENAVGDDARKIRQQGDAVVDVHPGKQPQQQGVDADGQGREIEP